MTPSNVIGTRRLRHASRPRMKTTEKTGKTACRRTRYAHAMTLATAKKPATPTASPAARTRAKFYEAGRKDKHQIERVIQSLRVDPNNPLVAFLEMGKIPQDQLDNFMILAAESILLPENKPDDLPEGSLNIWDERLEARLLYARMLGQWSVDGSMVDKLSNGLVGFVQMLMRPFRRRQMKEMQAGDEANAQDSEYD